MAALLTRSVLVLFMLQYSAHGTRFLPSVIWDHVNSLLCSPYNWLVVPRIDFHDILEFVCPTSKLVVKQVNHQTRNGDSMNVKLYRREWPGNVQDLQESISDGSIHSFCNISHPDSVELFTCRDGKYSSFPVKFTHFVFDEDRVRYEKYQKHKTYVFYSNGDGLVSSLDSKVTKCTMLFAVYTATNEKRQFDITYSKEVMSNQCNPAIKPTLATTVISESTPSTLESTTPSTLASTTTQPTTQESTSTLPPPTTTPSKATTSVGCVENSDGNKFETTTKITSTKPTDSDRHKATECKESLVSTPVFITIVIAAFITGILCTVLFYQVFWRGSTRRDGYHDPSNSLQKLPVSMSNGTDSERSRV